MNEEKTYRPGEKRPRDEAEVAVKLNPEVLDEEEGDEPEEINDGGMPLADVAQLPIEERMQFAYSLFATKFFPHAILVLNSILNEVSHTDALFFRGFSKFFLGQNVAALADIQAAINQEPDPQQKLFFQTNSPIGIKPLDEAEKLERRGFRALLWGKHPRAIAFYTQSIERRPIADAFWGRGLAHFLSGDLGASLADLQHAIDNEQDPEEKSFFLAEKLFVLDCVGEFRQTRQLWRNVKFADDENLFVLRYSKFKSCVCSGDVDIDEVKEVATDLFNRFAGCDEIEQEGNIQIFRSMIFFLGKYIFTLKDRDAEALDMVNFVADKLFKHLEFILENPSEWKSNNKIELSNLTFERLLQEYYSCLSRFLLMVRTIPGVVAAVKDKYKAVVAMVMEVEFKSPSFPFDEDPASAYSRKSHLTLVSKIPHLDSVDEAEEEEENPQTEIQNAEAALRLFDAAPRRFKGTLREIFEQIQAFNRRLLYGGSDNPEKCFWRNNHFLEFLHMLPEFSGANYYELFFSVTREILVAECRYVKIQWLEGELLAHESQELIQKSEQIFLQYHACVAVINEQNPVAKKVIRNAVMFFRCEQLDKLLFMLTKTAERLLSQSPDLDLVRQVLTLADKVNGELHSIYKKEDLSNRLLWDDNALPTRVKDFVVEHHENMSRLQKLREFDLRIREQEAHAKDEPLTVLYGKNNFSKKKTVVAIPFAPELSPAFLRQSYDRNDIHSSKNLMVGFVFTVTFSADCDGGKKYFTKHVQLCMNQDRPYFKFDDAARVCNFGVFQMHSAVLKNIRDGFVLYDKEKQDPDVIAKKVLMFSPSPHTRSLAQKSELNDEAHKHSEQGGVFWLMQKVDDVARQLITVLNEDPDFRKNGKLGNIEIDMISDKSSCDSCKSSMLALQASINPESFMAKLVKLLGDNGIRLAKKGLLIGSRVLSREQYYGDTQKGQNPTDKNVAHLKNLSIFQSTQPALFMSGNNTQSYSNRKKP